MKEKLNYLKNIKRNHLITAVVLLAVMAASTTFVFRGEKGSVANAVSVHTATSTIDTTSLVAVVGSESAGFDQGGANKNSWPAEIVSSGISNIQPQREGVMIEWNVRVGDVVHEGQIIGRISAPPATPELIKMLAEQMESRAGAQAKAQAAFNYMSASTSYSAATGLGRLGENVSAREKALRSFLERSLSRHIALTTYFQNWRDVRYGSFSLPYGSYSQSLKLDYEEALIKLVEKLKSSSPVPIADAERYFDVAAKLVSGSVSEGAANDFRDAAKDDQKDFYTMLSEYREAQAEESDKEAEYKQMISEADAADKAYDIVKEQITTGLSMSAPRSGTISAIYGKVGDLVKPDMAVAVIASDQAGDLTVRMHIPNNIRKAVKGDVLSVVRPGFGKDVRQVKVIGTGLSLDSTGSYMADAVFIGSTDWPIGSSVRVISPESSDSTLIKATAIWWSKDGIPHVWAVSEAGRIYAKDIAIGRTLGASVELYSGLKKGDKYIAVPTAAVYQDVFVSDLIKDDPEIPSSKAAKSSGHGSMPGMEM